jgi:hypothetical protein
MFDSYDLGPFVSAELESDGPILHSSKPRLDPTRPKPMMNGPETSDLATVATKPANKAKQRPAERSAAEPNAAEPGERRAGAKGNAD